MRTSSKQRLIAYRKRLAFWRREYERAFAAGGMDLARKPAQFVRHYEEQIATLSRGGAERKVSAG